MKLPPFKTYSLSVLVCCLFTLLCSTSLFAEDDTAKTTPEDIQLQVPDGFEVTLYAGDRLAHDIYSMTVDSKGRIVVSGKGYVRILIDSDNDGKAESFKQFADGPASGAQGMYFHGNDLFCTGDKGLIRYRDQNKDDKADGKPDLFLQLKTGGEHHAHAIQRGPDGWWYFIAGNFAGISHHYATLKTSPIKTPLAGTIVRLKPNLAGGEIVSNGFRNAYDFTFNGQGDVFVYDSDGERDVSLPWYRPTRVFHSLPASHAGWVSRSWKQPKGYIDMPPVVGSFGRGSPTGVCCYRHRLFPTKYRGAVFVLDWTFGRLIALPLKEDGSTYQSKPITFMKGTGQFGFAPTDIVVGKDGALYVSVGGRGTRGGVYRITPTGKKLVEPEGAFAMNATSKDKTAQLVFCLTAPQPLSSWSRAEWQPLATKLGRDLFLRSATNPKLSVPLRIRAIEIITELFGGLRKKDVLILSKDNSDKVRARAIWSYGRTHSANPLPSALLPFLQDQHPLVSRFALEALLGIEENTDVLPLLPAIAKLSGSKDQAVRQTASAVVARLPLLKQAGLKRLATKEGLHAELTFALGTVLRSNTFNKPALETGLKVFQADVSYEIKQEAIRVMQRALGDVGPQKGSAPTFDSYRSQIDLAKHERVLDPYRATLAEAFPTKDKVLNDELLRLLAMLTPYNTNLLNKVLQRIDDKSHPIDDIHTLLVASKVPVDRNIQQSKQTAHALVMLDSKIKSRKLNQDSNWQDRMTELYKELFKHDALLPSMIVAEKEFGEPGHVMFMSLVEKAHLPQAVQAFVKNIKENEDYIWTNDIIFVLGESKMKEHLEMVREQFDNYAVRNSVLQVLAEKAKEEDRQKLITGLAASQLKVITACCNALQQLSASQEGAEQLALLKAMRRLGSDKSEYPVREKVVQLLRRNSGKEFGFQTGKEGYRPQPKAVTAWFDWITTTYPKLAKAELAGVQAERDQLKIIMSQVDWKTGDIKAGEKLFNKRGCVQCHGGQKALGPDLAGAAQRFSRKDLFTAIAFPSKDVSPRYQTTLIETTAGKVYTGLIVYQAVDGMLLRNASGQTFRIEAKEIESRRLLNQSLMPNGLLKDLSSQDLANLDTYLNSLKKGKK